MGLVCDLCSFEWDEEDDLFICECGCRICSECAKEIVFVESLEGRRVSISGGCPKCGAEIGDALYSKFEWGWEAESQELSWRVANDK